MVATSACAPVVIPLKLAGMKMLAVDDHAVMRQGLAALLVGSGAAAEVVEAASLAEGLALAGDVGADFDAVLLDLQLPDARGVGGVAAFVALNPTLPIIVISASEAPGDVRAALDAGALGYVPKSAPAETLVSAVRLVMAGGIYLPPLMLRAPSNTILGNGADGDGAGGGVAALTPRQREVLGALAGGLSNKEIGRRFDLSEKTVKVHVGAILKALGVANRTQAARAAIAAGLVSRS